MAEQKVCNGCPDRFDGCVRLDEDQSLPKYDFTNVPTYFESGYNIGQQDMLQIQSDGTAFRKVILRGNDA